MIYNTFGSTGIEVSAIGFGGMRFENQDDLDGCAALVKAAYDEVSTTLTPPPHTANPKTSSAQRSRK